MINFCSCLSERLLPVYKLGADTPVSSSALAFANLQMAQGYVSICSACTAACCLSCPDAASTHPCTIPFQCKHLLSLGSRSNVCIAPTLASNVCTSRFKAHHRLLSQVAVANMHARSLVHADLKPENVLLLPSEAGESSLLVTLSLAIPCI